MKRILLLIISAMMTFTFVSCSSEEVETVDFSTLPYESYLKDSNPVVTIYIKDVGGMKLQLFPEVAENTVNNFIQYVQDNDYKDAIFHRVIEDFMIQGGIVSNTRCSISGDFYRNGFNNGLPHYRGVISMARTSAVNSATSQFFIMHKSNNGLNGNYAGFGGLIGGFDVLDLIATTETSNDRPTQDFVIEKVTLDLNGYVVSDVVCAD